MAAGRKENAFMWLWITLAVVAGFFLIRYLLDKFGSKEVTEQVTVAAMDTNGDAHFITYRNQEGKQRRCQVPGGEYERSRVGETGKLTRKRDVFVEFEGDDPLRAHR